MELKETVDYNKELASNDAKRNFKTIRKKPRIYGLLKVIYQVKGLLMLLLLYGLYQIILENCILLRNILHLNYKKQ